MFSKTLIIICAVIIFTCESKAQETSMLDLKFIKNGKEIAFDGEVNLYFVSFDSCSKTIIKPKLDSNRLYVIDFDSLDRFHVVVKHKKKYYLIKRNANLSNMKKYYGWDLIFDKNPKEEGYKFNIKLTNNQALVAIVYRLRYSDNIVDYTGVNHIRKYHFFSKMLVD